MLTCAKVKVTQGQGQGHSVVTVEKRFLNRGEESCIDKREMVDCDDYNGPLIFKTKRCFVHPLGKEEMCFYNGMHLLSINPKKNKQRPLKIKIEDSPFNWDSIHFPPTLEDLKQFEKNNTNVFLIVFEYNGESFSNFYLDRFHKQRHDSNTFVFVYHQGHFIAIVNKKTFFRFLMDKHRYVYSIPFLETFTPNF